MQPYAEFFLSLTKGLKAALPYFTSAAASNQGVNDILRQAREAGFSFRSQQARDVIGVLRNNIENNQTLFRQARLTLGKEPLDPKYYGVTIGKPLRNFSYQVEHTIRSLTTGEFDRFISTVSSNDILSEQDILDQSVFVEDEEYQPRFSPAEVISSKLISANRSPFYEI